MLQGRTSKASGPQDWKSEFLVKSDSSFDPLVARRPQVRVRHAHQLGLNVFNQKMAPLKLCKNYL